MEMDRLSRTEGQDGSGIRSQSQTRHGCYFLLSVPVAVVVGVPIPPPRRPSDSCTRNTNLQNKQRARPDHCEINDDMLKEVSTDCAELGRRKKHDDDSSSSSSASPSSTSTSSRLLHVTYTPRCACDERTDLEGPTIKHNKRNYE